MLGVSDCHFILHLPLTEEGNGIVTLAYNIYIYIYIFFLYIVYHCINLGSLFDRNNPTSCPRTSLNHPRSCKVGSSPWMFFAWSWRPITVSLLHVIYFQLKTSWHEESHIRGPRSSCVSPWQRSRAGSPRERSTLKKNAWVARCTAPLPWTSDHISPDSLGHRGDLDSKHAHGSPRRHALQTELPAGELHGELDLDLGERETAM